MSGYRENGILEAAVFGERHPSAIQPRKDRTPARGAQVNSEKGMHSAISLGDYSLSLMKRLNVASSLTPGAGVSLPSMMKYETGRDCTL